MKMRQTILAALLAAWLAAPVQAATPELHELVDAALSGDAEAQYRISRMYAHGRPGGLSQNFLKAAYWAEQAAQQGHPDAQYLRGLMYRAGAANETDGREGFLRCMSRAAEQGHPQARRLLNTLH